MIHGSSFLFGMPYKTSQDAEILLVLVKYILELCTQREYLSFSPLLFASPLFKAICKASSNSHFAIFHLFSMGMVLIPVSCKMSRTSIHSSSGTLSIRSNSFYCVIIRDFISVIPEWSSSFPFFNLSLNFATKSSWSGPQSAPSLVFADCIELLHFQVQRM